MFRYVTGGKTYSTTKVKRTPKKVSDYICSRFYLLFCYIDSSRNLLKTYVLNTKIRKKTKKQ